MQYVAAQPGAADRVREWRAKYGKERATSAARSFVVVGQTLMFLHTCVNRIRETAAQRPWRRDGRGLARAR